jgi:hypothetical protein
MRRVLRELLSFVVALPVEFSTGSCSVRNISRGQCSRQVAVVMAFVFVDWFCRWELGEGNWELGVGSWERGELRGEEKQ